METYRTKKKRNDFEQELSRVDAILCTSILMKQNGESVASGLFAMGTDDDIKIKHINRIVHQIHNKDCTNKRNWYVNEWSESNKPITEK